MVESTVLVGKKPFMNYVTAVVVQFKTEGVDKVLIRARGKYICKAVDVAEMVRRRFLADDVELESVKIDSEEKTNNQGKQVRISSIEIALKKKQ